MKVTEIEKLKQLVSRTDMSGNEKVEWLTDFIDKHVTEQLRLNVVSKRSELFKIRCTNCGIDEIITDKHCNCCGAKQPSYFK
jgi:hypothetical protein